MTLACIVNGPAHLRQTLFSSARSENRMSRAFVGGTHDVLAEKLSVRWNYSGKVLSFDEAPIVAL